jgi:hypothetical protein
MARLGLLVLVLAALGGVVWLFLGAEGGAPRGAGLARDGEQTEAVPELRGAGLPLRTPRETPPGAPGFEGGAQRPGEPGSTAFDAFLAGVVLADESGAPVEGASIWLDRHAEPCPRLPEATVDSVPRSLPGAVARTDAEGRFALRLAREDVPASGTVDLFASAKGRVAAVVCAPAIPGEVEVRLAKGLALAVEVRDPAGKPVEGALVRARPAPQTPAIPGHASLSFVPTTDKDGKTAIDGLLPGEILLDVDHTHFMPATVGPFDPVQGAVAVVELVPAYRVSFRLRTDDGRPPVHPTLFWETTGRKPKSDVALLPCPDDAGASPPGSDGPAPCGPVPVPCDAAYASLEVKADGYAPWKNPRVALPSAGGEKVFDVDLRGDFGAGSVRVLLEDEQGQKIQAATARLGVAVSRLDPGARPSAYVLEQTEDLRITSLPAGRYRLRITSPRFAPAEAEVAVVAGGETESSLRVRPPAKVRVRFYAPERTKVVFRVTQGGLPAEAIPENAVAAVDADGAAVPLAADADGIVLSGLASGTYAIEVLSENLVAPATVVRLVEGDTEEVEINVQPR